MSIKDQKFWDKLTHTTQKQSLELIRRKKRLNIYNIINAALLIACLPASFGLFSNKYLMTSLVASISILLMAGILTKNTTSLRKEYNELRESLMSRAETDFCACSKPDCECREEFIIYMENDEHINLNW